VTDTDERYPDRVKRGYDTLAANAADMDRDVSPWGDSYFQRYYAWPAAQSALPDVDGNRVLLAGCGRGDYVPWFREGGATVVGVDVSETAIRHARDRFGEEATFYRADLTTGLGFADSDTFDLVFSNLVLSHIEEWVPVFEEFARVLRPQGALVVTTVHPQYLRSRDDVEDYYTVSEIANDWPDAEIPTFYRPVNEVISPFLEAGFRLQTVDEPQPRDAYEDHHPKRYREVRNRPEIVVVRAQVDEATP
jgi:SAM-dependent methyltransferase